MLSTPDHERLPHDDSTTDSLADDEESYFPPLAVRRAPETMVSDPSPSRPLQPAHPAEASADENTAIVRSETHPGRGYMGVTHAADVPGRRATLGKNGLDGGGYGDRRRRRERSRRRRSSAYQVSARHAGDSDSSDNEHRSWWSSTVAKYGSISLDNKGSVARDHLALERTYLAYLRTSLAFSSIGIAVTQLFRLNTSIPSGDNSPPSPGKLRLRQVGKPLGIVFLGTAIIVLFVGFHRYFESQHWIIRGKFPASRGSVFFMSAVAAALMVVSLGVVIGIEPGALGGS
ncbi:MAG: hypothetical protein M1829_001243 [Trizodia sp. TS-e1964]|nr:MAG: hypothetical protein M1829_001243 [Trizodia sp. TS-e1964]